MVMQELPLENNSMVYNLWKDIPLPFYQKFYFFNVDNPSQFLDGAKLKLTQKGPYVYNTISYREVKTYHFVPELSNGTEGDLITTLNVPLLVAGGILKDASSLVRLIASIFFGLTQETLFIRRSVKQLTYGGYKDLLMEFAPLFNHKLPNMNGKFGYLYGKNATDDGLFTVYTGKSGLSKFNVIDRVNGKQKLDIWNKPTCNMINGTNGELNPPLKYTPDKVSFFQPLLCRTWTLKYQKKSDHYGLNSHRYTIDPVVFANATEEPSNSCYYPQKQFPYGVTGIAPCQYDAPAYLSAPHFYQADPSYLEKIDGLKPDPNLHEFFMDIEPYTGIAVGISAKFQANLYLSRINGVNTGVEGTQQWVCVQSLEYTKEYANMLSSQVYDPIQYCTIGSYSLISLGGALVVVTLLLLTCSYLRAKKALHRKNTDGPLITSPAESGKTESVGIVNPGLVEEPSSAA
ncbi:scav-3 [Cordylochernes scorpioides]|uniref:Scavenger receptor class B member 1 n=1 Tax=Cordylochernes scorpioides TaxID=51811 RepID=A0ABY6KXX9_9ARAC|nr:scav-3 [Cordylochernes scorpioides]